MYSTPFLLRFVKVVAVAATGLMALLVTFGNITDYYSNYPFVEHVLKMDTTFPESHIHYRSFNNIYVFHASYILIIVLETAMTFCCIKGSWLLLKNIKSSVVTFHASKNWAIAGITIGGEWFAMWQSPTWNGLGAAERIVSFLLLVLILLHLKEEEI
jgi:predicted small integral membrane protein